MTQNNGTHLPSYNGYNNKFSWLVALWLDNDFGLYSLISEWADDCDELGELAERVQVFVTDEMNPLADQVSMYGDLLGFALALIDYESVVDGYWEGRNLDEEEDDD